MDEPAFTDLHWVSLQSTPCFALFVSFNMFVDLIFQSRGALFHVHFLEDYRQGL